MAEEKMKTTIMVLKVDLECSKCYKKVKKVLAKFPQIRDQAYDFKANTVTIKVVCCSPEKIRDKICCKGGGSIKSIEIKPPEKKPEKPPEKKPEKPPEKKPEKPPEKKPEKPPEKKPEKPPEKKPEKPPEKKPEKPPEKKPEKPPEKEPEKKPEKPPEKLPPPVQVPTPPPPKGPEPPPAAPPAVYPPIGFCCTDCYHGHGGGPCYYGGPPPPCYDTYAYGRPVYDTWGGGGGGYRYAYMSRGDCFSEENPQGCSIM